MAYNNWVQRSQEDASHPTLLYVTPNLCKNTKEEENLQNESFYNRSHNNWVKRSHEDASYPTLLYVTLNSCKNTTFLKHLQNNYFYNTARPKGGDRGGRGGAGAAEHTRA